VGRLSHARDPGPLCSTYQESFGLNTQVLFDVVVPSDHSCQASGVTGEEGSVTVLIDRSYCPTTQDCAALLCTKCRAKVHTAHSCLPASEVALSYKKKLETSFSELEKG
jgi:hypothetical protein